MFRRLRSKAIDIALRALGRVYCRRMPTELRTLLRLLGPQGGRLSTGVSYADYLALYEGIRRRGPMHVLELGAGRSTAVMALAHTWRPGVGSFVAVEESQEWIADHRRIIPQEFLSRVELIQRDVGVQEVDGKQCASYKDIPVRPYEFVHIDGPALRKNGVDCSGDVIDLLPHLGRRCFITFDGREPSARFVQPYLERAGFRMRRHPFTLSYQFIR